MNTIPTRRLLALAIGAALAGAFVAPALAAPAPAPEAETEAQDGAGATGAQGSTQLEAITVSARRLDEQLQDVPVPVTAVSSETIERKGMNDVRDIAAFTPSFSFRSAFGRDGDRPVIRGMSDIQGEPNASFFIDGVYVQGDISGFGLENLERVEVVRGPQSAAFGRRTFSGAVNFVTRRPNNDPTGKLTLGGGSDGWQRVSAFYSGPIAQDLLWFDVGLVHNRTDGLFFNPVSGEKDIGGEMTNGLLSSLLFRPTDAIEVLARFGYQLNRDQPYPIRRQGSELNNCFLPEIIGTAPGTGFPLGRTRTRGYFCGVPQTPREFPINTPDFQLAGYGAGLRRDNLRSSVVVDWSLPNGWSLTSTSAYNETKEYSGADQDFSGIRGFNGAFETFGQTKIYDWSQDLRLTTDTSQPVYGLLGFYWYSETRGPGFSGNLSGFNLPPSFVRAPVIATRNDPINDVENRAVYGLVEWKIDERWSASAEVRYARDKLTLGGTDRRTVTTPAPPRVFERSFLLEDTFTSTTPRFTLSYQPTDDLNVYALASKGTKPGGFNTDVQRADLRDDSRQFLINEGLTSFKEETAWNYELGVKSDLLGRTLRLNANLFWIDWDNQQLTETRSVFLVNNSPFLTSFTTNIGKSRIRGLEIEGQWRAAEQALVNFSYSYNDAKIRDFISQDQADLFCNVPVPVLTDPCANARGFFLPRVPKHQAAIGVTLDGAFANGWGWFANADVNYESTRYTQVDNLAETGSSTRVNVRFAVEPGENWRVTAWVRNLFDDDTPEDILRYVDPLRFISVPNVLPPPAPARVSTNVRDFAITAPQPRMWGIEVSYRF